MSVCCFKVVRGEVLQQPQEMDIGGKVSGQEKLVLASKWIWMEAS